VDFDSLVRNSRQRLQIAGNNKIRAINREKQARYKTKIQVNAPKKKMTYAKQLEQAQK